MKVRGWKCKSHPSGVRFFSHWELGGKVTLVASQALAECLVYVVREQREERAGKKSGNVRCLAEDELESLSIPKAQRKAIHQEWESSPLLKEDRENLTELCSQLVHFWAISKIVCDQNWKKKIAKYLRSLAHRWATWVSSMRLLPRSFRNLPAMTRVLGRIWQWTWYQVEKPVTAKEDNTSEKQHQLPRG